MCKRVEFSRISWCIESIILSTFSLSLSPSHFYFEKTCNSDVKKPTVIAIILGPIVFAHGTLNAATSLHHNLLNGILGTSQRFFDTVPSGRILARFSSDLYTLDSVLPMKMKQIILFFFRVGVRNVSSDPSTSIRFFVHLFLLCVFDLHFDCMNFPFVDVF